MGLNGYGHGDVEARPKHEVACPAACVRSVSHARHPQTKQAGHQARPVFVGRAKNQSLDESRYSQWENPRLCRGGSSSLTFPGVHPETLRREPPSTPQGETGWTSMQA